MGKCISLLVFFYMCYRAVYGASEVVTLNIDPWEYPAGEHYLKVGATKAITCSASSKKQKVEWYNPNEELVPKKPSNRVFVQEHQPRPNRYKTVSKGNMHILTITRAAVIDSGVWTCKTGDLVEKVPICVIEPVKFNSTVTNITTEIGRSVELKCMANGQPESIIMWYKDEEFIDDDDTEKYKMTTKFNSKGSESQLTISSLVPEDAGVYSCEVYQENPLLQGCNNTAKMEILLNVNYAPQFRVGSTKNYYFSHINEKMRLVCNASAFPAPTYRWFRVKDVLIELKGDNVEEDGTASILTLMANFTNIGQIFLCRATNEYGDAYRNFTLIEADLPEIPSDVEVKNETINEIELTITWDTTKVFPIIGFDIQYIEKTSETPPEEKMWRHSDRYPYVLDEDSDNSESDGISIKLPNLKENTEYWIRLRVKNQVGVSYWSVPVYAGTKSGDDPANEEDSTRAPKGSGKKAPAEDDIENILFYLVFFAGGIIIVSLICTCIVRFV